MCQFIIYPINKQFVAPLQHKTSSRHKLVQARPASLPIGSIGLLNLRIVFSSVFACVSPCLRGFVRAFFLRFQLLENFVRLWLPKR